MLLNLLPGLRDLRAPLAAGYVWLLALYLALEPSLPGSADATGVWRSLFKLQDAVGDVGMGVAVSFLAYLVGSISEALRNFIVVGARKGVDWPAADSELDARLRLGAVSIHAETRAQRLPTWVIRAYRPYAAKSSAALEELVDTRLRLLDDVLRFHGIRLSLAFFAVLGLAEDDDDHPNFLKVRDIAGDDDQAANFRRELAEVLARGIPDWAFDSATSHLSPESLRDDAFPSASIRMATFQMTVGRIVDELDLMRTNLLGDEPELWSAIDRQRSEAEFRAALALPLIALAIALGWRATWWAAVAALAAAVVLVVQGVSSNRQSNDALIEALRLERAKSPSLERFDNMIKTLGEATNVSPHPPP